MGQLQLRAKKLAIVSKNQTPVNIQSEVKHYIDNERTQISLLPLIFFSLFFLPPGHALAQPGSNAGFTNPSKH